MKKWGFVFRLRWHFWSYLVPCTSYFVQWCLASFVLHLVSEATSYLVLCTSYIVQWSFNVERWTPIEEWRSGDLCSDSNGTSEGTWYLVLRTLYNEVLMSNAELRSKNEEVGICVPTHMALLKLLSTLYLVHCSMMSCFFCLASRFWSYFVLSTLYFVHCSFCFFVFF